MVRHKFVFVHALFLVSIIFTLPLLTGCPGEAVNGRDGGGGGGDSGSPVTDAGSPMADAGSPMADAGSPMADAGSPMADAGSPMADGGDNDAGAISTYLPLDDTSCAALCAQRANSIEGTGSCPFNWNSGDCDTRCEDEFSNFSLDTQTSFIHCTLNDPLCYLDVVQCVWNHRYQANISVPVTFSGTNFDAYNGKTIKIAVHTSGDEYLFAPDTQIVDGGFSVTWSVDSIPGHSYLFLYYIDVNGDSHCHTGDGGVDYAGSQQGVLGPNYDAPAAFGEDVYDADTHEFVCDYL
jgi:hypothetical protein